MRPLGSGFLDEGRTAKDAVFYCVPVFWVQHEMSGHSSNVQNHQLVEELSTRANSMRIRDNNKRWRLTSWAPCAPSRAQQEVKRIHWHGGTSRVYHPARSSFCVASCIVCAVTSEKLNRFPISTDSLTAARGALRLSVASNSQNLQACT